MSGCRNCNSCAYFPCTYYHYFNVDRNIGCIYWTNEIKNTYVSNQTVDYTNPTITDGTNSEHANLSDGTWLIDSQRNNK